METTLPKLMNDKSWKCISKNDLLHSHVTVYQPCNSISTIILALYNVQRLEHIKKSASEELTSASWDLAMSTRVLAAGWTTSSIFIIVAPSLDIVALPLLLTISLSLPLGPNVVLTQSAIAWHALMLEISCDFPWELSVPSLRRIICGCWNYWQHK